LQPERKAAGKTATDNRVAERCMIDSSKRNSALDNPQIWGRSTHCLRLESGRRDDGYAVWIDHER
jgi:hypothetical protein